MPRVTFVRVLLGVSLSLTTVAAQEPPTALQLGRPVERELRGGQVHPYTLTLAANQIARVVADQKGVDLVLSVASPDGTRMFDVDGPTGASGSETATFGVRAAGAYRVEVRSLDPSAPAGRYAIRLDAFLTDLEYTTEHLAGLGRLWGAARYFHPYLAHEAVDWDGALVKAVPPVKAARTPGEYRDAINAMLQALNDPATRAELPTVASPRPTPAPAATEQPAYFRTVDGVVVIFVLDWAKAMAGEGNGWAARDKAMRGEVASSRGVVLDCRFGSSPPDMMLSYYLSSFVSSTLPSLVRGSIVLGTERYRMHNGYAPQRANTSGGYWSGFLTETPASIPGQAKEAKPLAVVVDDRGTDMLPLLSGLQAVGAKVVWVGKPAVNAGGRVHQMRLPDGVRATLRVAEFVHPGGGSNFRPDVQLAPDEASGSGAISAAVTALGVASSSRPAQEPKAGTELVRDQADRPYADMRFPAEEYRLLALFRYWNVINYFYPYKYLTDRPWDAVLTDFIPRMLESRSALDYERAVAEMVARMQDSHGGASPLRALNAELGTFCPPVRLASAGGKLVVVDASDASVKAAGIKAGDVIIGIDGEPTAQRIASQAKYRALSTPQSAYAFIYPTVLAGAEKSSVTVRVESADGKIHDASLSRSVPLNAVAWFATRKTPVFHVMPNGYGYIDLDRLTPAEVPKALDAISKAPAVVFDMRGYPQGTAWTIAPRLGSKEKKNVTAALFRRPIQIATALDDEDLGGGAPDYSFEQKLPPAQGAPYTGKVVVLINEFAISQSEHTCLFFEAATDVTFLGSPTNGANGDVTNLVLPGGIYVNFTGHDVRHADGRQLQRVGIQPHIRVEPTPKGISEGRDEMLEAAVKYLDRTLKASRPVGGNTKK